MAGISVSERLLNTQEMIRLLLAKYTLKECAAILNVTYYTACRRARQPEFLEQLRLLNEKIYAEVDNELRAVSGLLSTRIVEMADVALEKLKILLEDDKTDDRLRARIAMDVLDRNTETSKNSKIMHESAPKINPRELLDAARVARELEEHVYPAVLETDSAT